VTSTLATAGLGALSAASGLALEAYRPELVRDRIDRALAREPARDVEELARRLHDDPAARARFRRSIAVSVSGLFRDPAQFDVLEHEVLPALMARGRAVTVWSAGCADGSELYSVAMLLERLGGLDRARLLGSDVLEENLALARRGRHGDVAIGGSLRARPRWERRDLTRDGPPHGRWRLVLCRNVAIYLAPAAREALHEMLAAALAPDGVLQIGRSERLSDPEALGLRRIAPHTYRKASP
jgi:chemotaxis protein methyltransferase CheR